MHQYAMPHRPRIIINAHWAHPPSWFIRSIKGAFVLSLVIGFFLLIVLVMIKASNPAVLSFEDATDDYVQRMGLCEHIQPLIEGTTNRTAITIYDTCRYLKSVEMIYYSRRDVIVNEFNVEYIQKGEQICKHDTDEVLLVHSYHDYLDRRQAIRETWGRAVQTKQWPNGTFQENVKIVFVLGLHTNNTMNKLVMRESDKYGDIIQGDFIDSYKNMTLKSLFGLKWVAEYCHTVKNMIKSDDDMFINFPYLLSVLRKTDMIWSIMGPLNVGAKVYRKFSKWSLSKSVFPFYYFPPYESGSTYVINIDLVKPLLECSDYVPYLWIDDVYITGILGRILEARHKHQDGFAYWIGKPPSSCHIINNEIITGTKVTPSLQYSLWKDIVNNNCEENNAKIKH